MALRCPLSVEQQKELRLYYSAYFAHLLSVTELLLDKRYPHRQNFGEVFETDFVFPGHPNGNENYAYVRELRNSIIHRGYDIASSAHVIKDFLLILAPEHATDRSGNTTYPGFGLVSSRSYSEL